MSPFKTIVSSLVALPALLPGATVQLVQDAVDDATAAMIGAVSADQYLETAGTYTTNVAPTAWSGYRFTHWTNSSYPATSYRDAWGRSLNPVSFVLLEDTTCTAHYLPQARDSDGDGLPDWYEIEYFGDLVPTAGDDGDGDGISLAAEFSGGTDPLYGNRTGDGGVAYRDSGLLTVNLAGFSRYVLRSEPAGTVDESASVIPGTRVTTPDLSGNSDFGFWTLDGVRQEDAWGRSHPRVSFVMDATDREAVAHLFAGDTDADGVADAFEQAYLGTLDFDGTHDGDGDGISLLAEIAGGTNPLHGNSRQDGGVAWADSSLVTINLAGFSRYTLASAPAGVVDESAVVQDGSTVTTPDITDPGFGYWELDGVRQQDAWGVALRQISFLVDGGDRTAIAHLFDADSDGDGVNDGFEWFHFGTLAHDGTSDTDGDGWSLLAEFAGGTSPLHGNMAVDGGVAWDDSELVVVNLQPYERLSKALVSGILTDFFSPDPAAVTGIQAGTRAAPAMSDWDGDGDLDLFVAHEDGLRVFRNIGTSRNPNFEEITEGFSGLAGVVTAIEAPVLAGGDWNNDGLGDLVIGGGTGSLRLVASGGGFSSDGAGTDLVLDTTRARPALGDLDGDGLADLLVLLDDGTVEFFPNADGAAPFALPGAGDLLGVAAPAGVGLSTGDLNQDGRADVLLSDADGRIWEFVNNGDGSFGLLSKVWGGSYEGFAAGLTLAAVDLEDDGDLDLVGGLANGGVIALRDPGVGRPTGLIAAPGANSVQLDWDANWQSRIRGYHVYRSTAAEGPWARLFADAIPLPSYLDTDLDPAVPRYYYYVTGISAFFLPGNSEPRTVESLPSELAITAAGKVVLSLRPGRGKPGQKLKLQLSIENATGVSGENLQLRIAYDPVLLTTWTQAHPGGDTVQLTGLSRNLVLTNNGATAAGELVINGTSGRLEPGSGTLLILQFEVDADVPKQTPLSVSILGGTMFDLDGNPLAIEVLSTDPPESGDDFILGDVDGDGTVTDADKELLKELIKPKSPDPTDEQLMAGDLNGDGTLSAKDVVLLMQQLSTS